MTEQPIAELTNFFQQFKVGGTTINVNIKRKSKVRISIGAGEGGSFILYNLITKAYCLVPSFEIL